MPSPKIATVIVNWNGWQDTLACLDSLQQTKYHNHLVVVVDNGSTNDSIQHLAKRRDITLLQLPQNAGFAAGQNAGIKHALDQKADFIFILNNDTEVAPDIFTKLLDGLKNKKVGAVAPRIYFFKPKHKIWWTGGFLDLANGRIINIQSHNLDKFPNGGRCDYLCGCAILVRAAVLKRVGLFDETYFHTAEDVDLSVRIRQAGYDLEVIPQASIWHKVSASSGGEVRPVHFYYLERNRLWLVKRYGSWSTLTWARIAPILTKRFIATIVKGRSLKSTAALLRAWIDFSRGKLGKTY